MMSSAQPTTDTTCRVIIVEDEVHARRYLRKLLDAEQGATVIGECADGADGAEMICSLSPDLVFIDIQMTELDGFDMITRIGVENMPPFIIVTGSSEYAARAFDLEALDYLCKPFGQERLHLSLERFRRYRGRKNREFVDASPPIAEMNRRRLSVKLETGVAFVPVEAVLWIEAANKYVILHTVERSYISRRTIRSLVDELGQEQFVRIHRSVIVRKNAVQEVRPLFHGDHHLVLKDGTGLTMSRHYREAFFSEMVR